MNLNLWIAVASGWIAALVLTITSYYYRVKEVRELERVIDEVRSYNQILRGLITYGESRNRKSRTLKRIRRIL